MEGAGSAPARCGAAAPRGAVIILVPVQVSPPQWGFRQGRNVGGSVPRFFFLLLGEGRGKIAQGYQRIKDPGWGMIPPSLRSQEPVRFPLGDSFKLNWGVKATCSRAEQEGCRRRLQLFSDQTQPSPVTYGRGGTPQIAPHGQVISYDTLLFGKH